jgi:hypothetical protein
MEKEHLYKELVSLIAPRVIAENFELVKIVEKSTSITVILRGKRSKNPRRIKG